MKPVFNVASGAVLAIGLAPTVQAQGFDPLWPCSEILADNNKTTLTMVGAWALGYMAAQQPEVWSVDLPNISAILGNLDRACAENRSASLLMLLAQETNPVPQNLPQDAPQAGSEADAHRTLSRFLEPDTDLVAVTKALFPNEADIRAVYENPLADALVETLLPQFEPGLKFAPKPGQTELLMFYTTTKALREGDPIISNFPGGYKDVVQYMKGDFPIVRFKFVKPGASIGMAYDGLVFVDGRWVIIPKPWRAL